MSSDTARLFGLNDRLPDEKPRWFEHPDRPCKNNPGYADLSLMPNKNDRIDAATACASCPVFFDCLDETNKFSPNDLYGIRAGMIGKVG